MSETGTKLQKEAAEGEVIAPEAKLGIQPPKNLMDLLMTAAGTEIANKTIEFAKLYAEANAKAQVVSTAILAFVIAAALGCATFLAYHGKFDGGIGTLVGTLVGFLVGRKSSQ